MLFIVFMLSLALFAQVDELKAKLAENPADIESLDALLEIYAQEYDYESYLNTVEEVAMALDTIPDEMLPYLEESITLALDYYYSEQAQNLAEIYFSVAPSRNSLLLYLRSVNDNWTLEEDTVREAVSQLEEEETPELYRYLFEQASELYPSDLALITSKILVEDFGEIDFLLPYIKNLLFESEFENARDLLNSYESSLEEEPLYYYFSSFLALYEGEYDKAVELYLEGKSRDDGTAVEESLEVLDYIYVSDYVLELFKAIVLAEDEVTLADNLQEYLATHEELAWIYSWISKVPAPKKVVELLAGEEVVISYNALKLEMEKINIGFFDIDGVLQGTVVQAIYGQFLDARSYLYLNAENDRAIVEGERQAKFMGYDVYSLSPDRSMFLLLESYGDEIIMIGPELEPIWSVEGEFQMIPPSWSPDGARVVLSLDYDTFSVIDTQSGEVIQEYEGYDFVFLSQDGAYAIDWEGNIIDLSSEETLKTDKLAYWASVGIEGKILYYEYPEEYADFASEALHVFDTQSGSDRVLASNVLFMDAPVPSVKLEGPYVYFTEIDENGMYKVIVQDYTTNALLFEGKASRDLLLFPDVRPE